MLCLTRKLNQEIKMDGGITIQVIELSNFRVKLGITAPESINIWRSEIPEEPKSHTRKSQSVKGDATQGK